MKFSTLVRTLDPFTEIAVFWDGDYKPIAEGIIRDLIDISSFRILGMHEVAHIAVANDVIAIDIEQLD